MDHGVDSEVHFKADVHEEEERDDFEEVVSAPPTPITQCDMDTIIRGWEEKFQKMLECLAEVQRTSERASSDICLVNHEARVQAEEHDRRLADFLRQIETARTPAKPRTSALRASTPKVYTEFDFDESPVGRDEVPHPELNSLPHTRSARTEDYDSIETHMGSARNTLPHIGSARTAEITDAFGDTRSTLPHIGSARTVETTDAFGDTRSTLPQIGSARTVDIADAFGDTHNTLPHTSSARTEESSRFRDTRTRDKDARFRLDEQPTHEDDRRNSGDLQQSSYHPGHTLSFARQSASPKVPTFDGTNTAQFRPWIIQFEAIARHQGWTAGERVVRLVSSLTGPAANLLIGMTLGQLDDYNFLRTRLSRRYDPPEREEAHRAELRARTRRRNESADEFAENIKNLAQRAYPLADQNMLDNLVVERFREGHGNEELKKHLCLYPSTGLQDLIGACVRFETHVELGLHARKSNEGLYTVQGNNRNELTLEEVTRAARRLGFGLRPWITRQQNPRGFNNNSPARNQNRGEQQQSFKPNQSGNGSARIQNQPRRQTPIGEVKCWTCGKTGHFAYDCKSSGPKFAFAPKAFKINFLQQIADQVQEYSEEEQNPRPGNA